MTRPRKSLPGRLSLLDLLPSPATVPPEPAPQPVVIAPEFIRDDALIIPPCDVETSNKCWYCVCDPSGASRDAVAILYGVEYRKGHPFAIICPLLKQRWDTVLHYCDDCLFSFHRAARAYAADLLGLAPENLDGLTYTTIAWRNEERPILRDMPHRGNVRPRVAVEPAQAVPEPEAPAVPEPEVPAEIEPPYLEHGVLRLPRRPDGATQANWRCYIHPDGSYRDAVVILYRIGYAANVPTSIQCPALDCRWDASRDFVRDCAVPFYAAADAHAAGLLGMSASEAGALAYLTMAYSQETRPILRNVGHLDDTRPTLPAREAA